MSIYASRCLGPLAHLIVVLQLRAMQRRLPNVHRGWVHTERGVHGIRPETDVEYLTRLRDWARERSAAAELHPVAHGHHRLQ
jgi:hypothetical protein